MGLALVFAITKDKPYDNNHDSIIPGSGEEIKYLKRFGLTQLRKSVNLVSDPCGLIPNDRVLNGEAFPMDRLMPCPPKIGPL